MLPAEQCGSLPGWRRVSSILWCVRRGVLGGTFDPPHLAHLAAAEAAYRQLDLDVVTFVPAGAPWQKAGDPVSAPVHRLEMMERAVREIDYFDVDDLEVRRDGWTYTIDTLAVYAPLDDLTLILGSDAARGVPSWHRADDVLSAARFAIVPRPGIAPADVDEALAAANVVWLDMPELDISSTDLRRRVAAGDSVRFLVPEPVDAYIAAHGLYRES